MSDPVMIREFGYSLSWHWGWVVLCGLVTSLLVLFFYFKERGNSPASSRLGLAAIRILLGCLVLLGSMNWYVVIKKFRRAELLICFDNSASLQHLDRLDAAEDLLDQPGMERPLKPSRINVLKAVLDRGGDEWLNQLQKDFSMEAFTLGEDAKRLQFQSISELSSQLPAKETQSRLDERLDQLLRRQDHSKPAAVLFFTDGLDSDDRTFPRTLRTARSLGIPIFPVGLGEKKPANDLRMVDLEANRRVFLNDLVEFRLSIAADGLAGKKTQLQLIDNQAEEIVAQKEIIIPVDQYRDLVRFRVRMLNEGNREFVARLIPLEEEYDRENNRQTIRVDVGAEKIKVLLAANYPSREFHFLKQFLGRESKPYPGLPAEFASNRIELHTFLQQADIEYTSVDRHAIKIFPVTRKQLFAYDVVIFCDLKPNWAGKVPGGLGTSELEYLREFVEEQGGGLIFVAGPKYTPQAFVDSPIRNLFPIDISGLQSPRSLKGETAVLDRRHRLRKSMYGSRFLPLELGSDTDPKPFTDFEGAYWYASSKVVKPSATVLAELYSDQTSIPGIVVQRVGNGTVLYQAFPETYRWRFRTSDIYFGRYWSQMIQFLASSKLVNGNQPLLLETDRSEYYRDEPVEVLGRLLNQSLIKDQSLSVTLRNRSGYQRRFSLTRSEQSSESYAATLSDLGAGKYEVFLSDNELVRTEFEVVDSGRENQRQPINEANLKRLAKATGGVFTKVSEISELVDQLPNRQLLEMGGEPPWFFWRQWEWASLFGALFLILISTEWILRKRCSLL